MEQCVTCPICKTPAKSIPTVGDYYEYSCPRCGIYSICGSLEAELAHKNMTQTEIGLLSGHLKEATLYNGKHELITTYLFDLLEKELPKSVPEKQNKLLRALEKILPTPGSEIIINLQKDVALAWAANEDELKFHLQTLQQRKLISIASSDNQELDDFVGWRLKILGKGWDYLDEHNTDFSSKFQAFVAMKFGNSELDDIYDNFIEGTLENSGYKAYRVDRDKENTEKIDNKIIAEIKDSRFVVADVTGQRQSVYYEAGFAQGLGIPVIWAVNEKEVDKLHFDTRQYPHLVWKDGPELAKKLEEAVLAQVGRGSWRTERESFSAPISLQTLLDI